MSILEDLIQPWSLQDFQEHYLYKQPFSAPATAKRFRRLIGWDLIFEILEHHSDCWLPKQGRLPLAPELATGRLTPEQAQQGFVEGRTLLIRHSERAHPTLADIAADFYALFENPVDIQLYCTPAGEEGFDWHYDLEDVFVIQSSGEKEFRLRQNRKPLPAKKVVLPKNLNLADECVGPELRCRLQPGDWLYIPAGFWHKARALTPSFHLSVGVLSQRS